MTSQAPRWWVIIALVVGTVVANTSMIIVIGRIAQAESRKTVCDLVVAQDDLAHDPDAPVTTERGRRVAEAWRALRIRWSCG